MKRVEHYRCEECNSVSKTKKLQCINCGSFNSYKPFYKTECCSVIIHEKELWCPQCGDKID